MQARGNEALALLLTVASSLGGIVSVPVVLKAMPATEQLDAVSLLVKLVLTVLVPLLLGKLAREGHPERAAVGQAAQDGAVDAQ